MAKVDALKPQRTMYCAQMCHADDAPKWASPLATRVLVPYKAYSKLRTRTAVGSYSKASPRIVGPP